jgi:hypothetical protein
MLDPSSLFSFYNDKLYQGDSIGIKLLARNLSNKLYDSALIDISIADESRIVKYKNQFKMKALQANDSFLIEK